jgi:hypothetical protein
MEIQQLQMRRQAGRSETAADAGINDQRLSEALANTVGSPPSANACCCAPPMPALCAMCCRN